MEEKPRYSRVSDILDLAVFMASKIQGITISDIMERYNVSRRTAERMRDSLVNIFPSIDEIESNDNHKHWGFFNYSVSQFIIFNDKEIANLEQIKRRTTNIEMKEDLTRTIEKIKALNRKNNEVRENSIELYMQTEGYAVRQTPQHKINLEYVDIVREALQNSKKIECTYHDKKRILEPLGMIYGEKLYLIAKEKKKGNGIYSFLFHKIKELKLTDKTFNKGKFNLQEYTNQSFGVYHGEILNVELLFSKELKEEAKNYNFHPTQKMKEMKDGTLKVSFKASGEKEIIWHVFRWGKDCKIITPKKLKKEYKKYLEENLKNYL